MKYNVTEIMKRAWEIKRQDTNYIFGGCLKMAWAEAKASNVEDKIAALEAKGFRRWTKAGYDRLYINATDLGLEISRYNTGNISSAKLDGEKISNRLGGKYVAAKIYVEIKTWRLVVSAYDEYVEGDLRERAESLMAA